MEQQTQTASLIEFSKSQLGIIVATVTVLFLVLTFVFNLIESKVGTNGGSEHGQIVKILEMQTDILNRMESKVNDSNSILNSRTATLTDTKKAAEDNAKVLVGIAKVLEQQTRLLEAQTGILQRMAVQIDLQFKDKKQ